MAWSVEGIRAKLNRVDTNLRAFADELSAYVKTSPHSIVSELDSETGGTASASIQTRRRLHSGSSSARPSTISVLL
jgi:hypothetical protein